MSRQNSMRDGRSRKPDQVSGRGMSPSPKRRSNSAARPSSSARLSSGRDWSLAQAPGTPKGAVIDTTQLTNATTLRWRLGAEPDLAGYEVVWRETTAPDWQRSLNVGNVTTATIDLSKDNVFFGVRAVDAAGHRSPAAAPRPSS